MEEKEIENRKSNLKIKNENENKNKIKKCRDEKEREGRGKDSTELRILVCVTSKTLIGRDRPKDLVEAEIMPTHFSIVHYLQ